MGTKVSYDPKNKVYKVRTPKGTVVTPSKEFAAKVSAEYLSSGASPKQTFKAEQRRHGGGARGRAAAKVTSARDIKVTKTSADALRAEQRKRELEASREMIRIGNLRERLKRQRAQRRITTLVDSKTRNRVREEVLINRKTGERVQII